MQHTEIALRLHFTIGKSDFVRRFNNDIGCKTTNVKLRDQTSNNE